MNLYKIRRREFLHLSAAAVAMTCGGDPGAPTTPESSSTGDGSTTSGTSGTPTPTTTADPSSTSDGSTTSGTTGTSTTTSMTDSDTTSTSTSTSTTGEPASTTTGEPASTSTGEPASTTTGEPASTTGESSDTGVSCTPMGVDTGLIAADFMVDACKPTANVMQIYVLRDADGFYAMTNICTHSGCTVPCPVGGLIKCPCHGSQYDANGDVVQGPAPADLVHYLVSFECVGDEAKIYVDKSQVLADRTTRVLPP